MLYSDYFQDISTESLQTLADILRQNGITYTPKSENYPSTLEFRHNASTLDSLDVEVTLGYYHTNILIFIINLPHNFCIKKQFFAKGAFDQVNLIKFQGAEYVTKLVKIKDFNTNSYKFRNVLKEIFLSKIMSVCNLGPKLYNICGYDAIWFKDGVQFVLEKF